MANNEEDKFLKKAYPTILKKLVELIPIGNIATTAFDLINEGKRAIDNDKFHNFIMGIQEHDEGDIDLSNESFIALVKRLYLDDESSKTDMYAKLAVALAKSELSNSERIYYINILSSLTYDNIEFARKYYIYYKYEIEGYKDKKEQQIDITNGKDGLLLNTINKLVNNGLLYDDSKKTGSPISATPIYEITLQFSKLIQFIYSESDLIPESINKKGKKIFDIVIVKHRVGSDIEFDNYLSNGFKKYNFSIKFINYTELYNINIESKSFIYKNKLTDYSDSYNKDKIIINIDNRIDKIITTESKIKITYYSKDNKVGNKEMNKALDEVIEKTVALLGK